MPPATDRDTITLSIIAPAHNEAENVAALIEEIDAVIETLPGDCEVIIVNDASTDATGDVLAQLAATRPHLNIVTLEPNGPQVRNGQSAAFHAAIQTARGERIAMLDADLQNDPADIPALLKVMDETHADLVQGDRSRNRRDSVIKKCSSWVGRMTRRLLLNDSVRDTGCSLRVLTSDLARDLPLDRPGMHRFIPIIAIKLGRTVMEHPVNHRPRTAGRTKYGITNRAIPGLIDCFRVRRMSPFW